MRNIKVFKCVVCGEGFPCYAFDADNDKDLPECVNNCDKNCEWLEDNEFKVSKNEQIPEPKPEKVKFLDVIEKMEVGDRFDFGGEVLTMVRHSGGFNVFKSDQFDGYVLLDQEYLKSKGRLIKAEPVVLSAEKWFDNTGFDPMTKKDAVYCFEAGDKNGQLKQWLAHEELREVTKKYIDEFNGMGSINTPKFKAALEKIKPLED